MSAQVVVTRPALRAADLVLAGMCSAQCLLALEEACACRCTGRYHGALADALVLADFVPGKAAPAKESTKRNNGLDVDRCIQRLNELGVPLDWSRRMALDVLRENGYRVRTMTIAEALRVRRERSFTVPPASGCPCGRNRHGAGEMKRCGRCGCFWHAYGGGRLPQCPNCERKDQP